MPTQAFPYAVMTDGTTTVTFADGLGGQTNWSPVRDEWAPAIGTITDNPLVGKGSRNVVTEDFLINIYGSDAATALANYNTLQKLIDQGKRFWRGESVLPVFFYYAPQGSTISSTSTPLKTRVMGPPDGDEPGTAPSPSFNNVGLIREIPEVRVRFLRDGPFYLDTESDDSGAAVAINETMTCNLTALDEFGPSYLAISGFNPSTTPDTAAGFVLFMDGSKYTRVDASGLTATGFASQADAANLPRNTNVLRYTGTVTTTRSSGAATINLTGITHYEIYVSLRNNHASATFQVSATLTNLAYTYTTEERTVDASSQNPRYMCLGILPAISAADTLKLNVAASTSAGSPTLDFDQIFIVGVNNEGQRAIAITSAIDLDGAFTSASTNVSLVIDHRLLTKRTPQVAAEKIADGTRAPATWKGNAFLVSKESTVQVVVLMPRSNYWRFTNASNAVITTVATITRTKAYTTPR